MSPIARHGIATTYLIAIAFAMGLLLGTPRAAYCDTVTIDFETLPSLPAQPNNFFAAGPMQTYSKPGIFTISGGVVLGNPVFLPAFDANGTVPNLYGTADFADPSLSSTIVLDLSTTVFRFMSVSFLLFNGQATSERYMVFGTTEGAVLDPLPIGPLASVSASGFTTVNLSTPSPITRLNIAPLTTASGWDFGVDKVILTGTPVDVPEPSSLILLITAPGALVFVRFRRTRNQRQHSAMRTPHYLS